MPNETFLNAPLVEVIAEVRWALTPLKTVPNGGIDPFHDAIKGALGPLLADAGFKAVREIVPADVPREFLAGQITTQYRTAADKWPLYQFGPGIFTVNITDDYTGWGSLQKVLRNGIDHLIKAHPAPVVFQLQALKLIAIDAFTERHNYMRYSDFTERLLPLGNLLPHAFISQFAADPSDVVVRSEALFPLRNLSGSFARISFADGKKEDSAALLVHTTVETAQGGRADAEAMKNWFDLAHAQHREMFRSLLSPELHEILRPKEMV